MTLNWHLNQVPATRSDEDVSPALLDEPPLERPGRDGDLLTQHCRCVDVVQLSHGGQVVRSKADVRWTDKGASFWESERK